MPKILALREVNSLNGKDKFLSSAMFLPPVILSTTPGWLIIVNPLWLHTKTAGSLLRENTPFWNSKYLVCTR
jgi:hypothetical protein